MGKERLIIKTNTGKIIITFAIISIIIGIIHIILGQTECNSIIEGFFNGYKYFIVSCILLGLNKLIDLVYDIKEKL